MAVISDNTIATSHFSQGWPFGDAAFMRVLHRERSHQFATLFVVKLATRNFKKATPAAMLAAESHAGCGVLHERV